jgi:broad specificity phosphatase PhoE
MIIIYCHHGHRKRQKEGNSENDGLTSIGIKDSKLVAKLFCYLDKRYRSGKKLKAIYSSQLFRCTETTRLINSKINIPVFYDERLNKFNRKSEKWINFQNRIKESLFDIVCKHNDNDMAVCVTSGTSIV